VLEMSAVSRLLASAERTTWWHQRLERCVALL